MLSYSHLYILFVLTAVLLFNCLIVLARFSRQIKEAPVEKEYLQLENLTRELQQKIETQNQEIVELQMKILEASESSPSEPATTQSDG